MTTNSYRATVLSDSQGKYILLPNDWRIPLGTEFEWSSVDGGLQALMIFPADDTKTEGDL